METQREYTPNEFVQQVVDDHINYHVAEARRDWRDKQLAYRSGLRRFYDRHGDWKPTGFINKANLGGEDGN